MKNNALVYFIVFINGSVSLILEVLGSRILAPFYGSTIYVWSSLISVALGFLALGYFIGGIFSNKLKNIKYLGLILILTGTFEIGMNLLKKPILVLSDNFGIIFGPLVSSVLMFFIPFVLIGMVTPIAIAILTAEKKQLGNVSGKVFGFATIGSLVGALVSGFYLIPNFSILQIILGSSILMMIIGGVAACGSISKKLNIILFLIVFLLFGLFVRLSHWPEQNHFLHQYELVLESRTLGGDYKLIGIPRVSDGSFCLLIDATNQGCIDPRNFLYGTNYAVIADIIDTYPTNSDVLILGGGVGEFIKYRARSDINYDVVDINPKIPEFFRIAGVDYNQDRVKFIISDARTYLRKNEKKYDVIFNDLIGNLDPVSNASTKEFFELSRERMKDGGVMIGNVFGKTDGSDEYVDMLIETVSSVFGSINLLDEPNNIITYQVFAAGLSKERLSEAREITAIRSKREFVDNISYFNYIPTTTKVITDEKNNLDTLWIKAISAEMNTWEFRDRFKRISSEDYL